MELHLNQQRWIFFGGMIAFVWGGASSLQAADEGGGPAGSVPVPEFRNPPEGPVSAGYLTLEWSLPGERTSLPEGMKFVLEEDTRREFSAPHQRFQGRDLASFVSGLPNGEYWFRVRVVEEGGGRAGAWSEPVKVVVEHHSLNKALIIMGIGAVVFLATVILILVGNAKASLPSHGKTEALNEHQGGPASGGA